MILAREERLRESERLLAEVARSSALDGAASDAFEEASRLRPRLMALTKLHLEQEEKAKEMSAESLALVAQYNEVVETVSRALIGFDKAIAKAEDKAEAAKRNQ